MTPIDKEREWAYIQACPADPMTPAEAESLESMLKMPVMRKALGLVYREVQDTGQNALKLKLVEQYGLELAKLQGRAAGMARFIDGLFDLTERPRDVSTNS